MSPNCSQLTPVPATAKKAGVLYYLSRNGQLEHPHFIEVPFSSPQGLYLRDVIDAFSLLRGQGMAGMYSWASKRSYKNGYLWQDLLDDDIIHPSHGQDYILKGSLLIEASFSFRSTDSVSSSRSRHSSSVVNNSSSEDSNSPSHRRKNYSFDAENKVYIAKAGCELSRTGSNVSTQTDDVIQRVKSEMQETREELSIVNVCRKGMRRPAVMSKQDNDSGRNFRYQQEQKNTRDSKLVMKLIGCGCGTKKFNEFDKVHHKY